LENENEHCVESEEQFILQPDESATKYVLVNGRIDYQCRSAALDTMCLYDYIRFYRKKPMDANDQKQLQAQAASKSGEPKDPRRGRPPCERECFQPEHPQALSHINIKRTKSVVPVLLGSPIPRRDRDDMRERYCRSILTLFVPWRSVHDVCDVDQTWEQAFEIRHPNIAPESQKFIENIQLLQECKKDRDDHLQQVIEAVQTETIDHHAYPSRVDDDSDEENDEILDMLASIDMDEVLSFGEIGIKPEERYFQKTLQAVAQANRFAYIKSKRVLFLKMFCQLFLSIDSNSERTKRLMYIRSSNERISHDHEYLIPVTNDLLQLNKKWQRKIKEEKERRRNTCINEEDGSGLTEQNGAEEDQLVSAVGTSTLLDNDDYGTSSNFISIQPVATVSVPSGPSREQIAEQFTLNKNQKAAFMIITGHLDGLDELNAAGRIQTESSLQHLFMTLDGKQDQLIMCVPGCGGTGKSQLIRAITAYFAETKRARKLRKLAPTSVAAAEIDGMTIHSFLGEGRNTKTNPNPNRMSRPGQSKLENVWRFVEYVILDEMSMVGLSLLARLSKIIATAKHADPIAPMGGVNIILFGDYMQYSPVRDKPLYHEFPTTMNNKIDGLKKPPCEKDIQQKSARALILQINCVVILEQQMRTKDNSYRDLLNRVRRGEGTYEDWLLLQTRVIGTGLQISLKDSPWNEVWDSYDSCFERIK
jgi:hypothetical protein